MTFDHVAQQVPDIAEAVEWQRRTVPGTTVLHQDATWALVESGGARPEAEHGAEIATHRDATRSIHLPGPGALQTEIIAYPPGS